MGTARLQSTVYLAHGLQLPAWRHQGHHRTGSHQLKRRWQGGCTAAATAAAVAAAAPPQKSTIGHMCRITMLEINVLHMNLHPISPYARTHAVLPSAKQHASLTDQSHIQCLGLLLQLRVYVTSGASASKLLAFPCYVTVLLHVTSAATPCFNKL
jgi:hypothetical protein